MSVGLTVGRSDSFIDRSVVDLSVIVSLKGGKLHFKLQSELKVKLHVSSSICLSVGSRSVG